MEPVGGQRPGGPLGNAATPTAPVLPPATGSSPIRRARASHFPWASEMDGEYADLPEGISDLRDALHDDLHHVGVEATNHRQG